MGQAKRKSLVQAAREAKSRPLKRSRFDLYALGAIYSFRRVLLEELQHWCDDEERVLGMVCKDVTDQDYGWVLMARDKIGRFRCVDCEAYRPALFGTGLLRSA